jgi:NADPH-dependent 2,4-dienoyl-CoA reductase/sulfur reductase-like enzyme/nitrite reductase/ring-hydroxylating ferredoxin subunit
MGCSSSSSLGGSESPSTDPIVPSLPPPGRTIPAGPHALLTLGPLGPTAFTASCPHLGAPLTDTVVVGDRLVCPWHAACFHAGTGEVEEGPTNTGLVRYGVTVGKDGRVRVLVSEGPVGVRGDDGAPGAQQGQQNDTKHTQQQHPWTVVVVGGGGAGGSVCLALRDSGFSGRIVLVTAEESLPIDRTKLSKTMELPVGSLLLAPPHGRDLAVEVVKEAAVGLDVAKRVVRLASGDTLKFDRAVICTGSRAVVPDLPGSPGVKRVHTLRTFADYAAIGESLAAVPAGAAPPRVVLIGGGFISMELASTLVKGARPVSVTIVTRGLAMEKSLGRELASALVSLAESKGVVFRRGAASALRSAGAVTSVVLDSGDAIDADVVVIAAGAEVATEWLAGSLRLGQGGAIAVDRYLRAGDAVYAAGECAIPPGSASRVDHWHMSVTMGRHVGRSIATEASGKPLSKEFQCVPFFWSSQNGVSVRVAGRSHDFDDTIVATSPDGAIAVFFIANSQVVGVGGIKVDPVPVVARELLRLKRMPKIEDIKAQTHNPKWLATQI